jgi:hypothetical protein
MYWPTVFRGNANKGTIGRSNEAFTLRFSERTHFI